MSSSESLPDVQQAAADVKNAAAALHEAMMVAQSLGLMVTIHPDRFGYDYGSKKPLVSVTQVL